MTSERKNIVQPTEWWDAAEQEARKQGKSLSEWIGDRILEGLPVKIRKQLPERESAGRPKKES